MRVRYMGDYRRPYTWSVHLLDIEGCIVTIDAMGCQTKIAHAIIERKADYAPVVKENQKELHANILDTFRFVSKENVTSLEDLENG